MPPSAPRKAGWSIWPCFARRISAARCAGCPGSCTLSARLRRGGGNNGCECRHRTATGHRPQPARTTTGAWALAVALVGYGALTGSARHLDLADAALTVAGSVAARDPRFAGWTLAGAEARLAGPLQVAIVGTGPEAEALRQVALASSSPGLVLVAGLPDAPGVPLLAGRPLVGGAAAAYVCRGFVCDRPVTAPADLALALARLGA